MRRGGERKWVCGDVRIRLGGWANGRAAPGRPVIRPAASRCRCVIQLPAAGAEAGPPWRRASRRRHLVNVRPELSVLQCWFLRFYWSAGNARSVRRHREWTGEWCHIHSLPGIPLHLTDRVPLILFPGVSTWRVASRSTRSSLLFPLTRWHIRARSDTR